MRRLGVPLCLLAFAFSHASASASFDPPNGAVIQANLPTTVSVSYTIDLEAVCGTQQADVSPWLRGPSGQELQPVPTQRASGSHEQSFGVDMTAFGLYAHWVSVRCVGAATEQRLEEGFFTVGEGDPESGVPGDRGTTGGGGGPGGTGGALPRPRACRQATTELRRARTILRQTKRSLKRKQSAKRRRAVRRASRVYKTAQKRKRSRCA